MCSNVFFERICPVCGRNFLLLSSEWAYRWKKKALCSYKCKLKLEKQIEEEKEKELNNDVTNTNTLVIYKVDKNELKRSLKDSNTIKSAQLVTKIIEEVIERGLNNDVI